MRAVLVGCGAMSKAWLEALRQVEGVTVSGLVDIDPARAEARAAEFGLHGVVIGSDLEAILDKTKPKLSLTWRFQPRAAILRSSRFRPRLPSADGEAARRQPRER